MEMAIHHRRCKSFVVVKRVTQPTRTQIITLPIAFVGYVFFPGLPSSKRPWYMTPEEHQLATDRLPKHQETKAKRLELSVVTETIKKPSQYAKWARRQSEV
jgi:hypothetical protein